VISSARHAVEGASAPFSTDLPCSRSLVLPTMPSVLDDKQIRALRAALQGRLIALCFGAGVDSTAMVAAHHAAGLRPDVITFADTGGEKKSTLLHLHRMQPVLAAWGWPAISIVRKRTLPTTGYSDMYGNCCANETLPSLAFGMKSCSIKYKVQAQDQFIKGAKRGPNVQPPHPVWLKAQRTGTRITKLIGYDCSKADQRRSGAIPAADGDFDYCYPLQLLGWTRRECVSAIALALGRHMVPEKSACTFCPASKVHELYWLAAHEPDRLEAALRLEYRALTGRHSRFDAVAFGATWEELIRTADRFPSTATCVGLGRSFSWCQWARVNDVADARWRVHRSSAERSRFVAMSESLRRDDNAFDVRELRRSTSSYSAPSGA